MDFFSSMRVSASGLDAQMKRMNTISSNIANSETTRTAEGGPYRRQDPVFRAAIDAESFDDVMKSQMDQAIQGVEVEGVQQDVRAPRMVYEPSHPDANAEGYVAKPNVNPVEEMSNMISTQRSYEANVNALGAAKAMAQKALEIGR